MKDLTKGEAQVFVESNYAINPYMDDSVSTRGYPGVRSRGMVWV